MSQQPGTERRIVTNSSEQLIGAVARVFNGGDLRSTDTSRFRGRVAQILGLEKRKEELLGASLNAALGFDQIEPLIESQHEAATELLKRGGLTDGIQVPNLQETMDVLGGNYTDEQIAEILKMQRAALQIVPKKPFTSYIAGINANKRPGQIDTHVSPYLQKRFTAMPSGNGVSLGFVEGLPELAGDPALVGRKLKDQEKDVKAALSDGVNTIHPRSYALLQLDGMQSGELVDRQNWSALEDGSAERSYVPEGYWYGGRVGFGERNPENEDRSVRWRRAVMVKKN